MRQIRDKYLQKRPGTDICSDMRHTYTSMAGYLASINVMSSILLYTYILKGNLCRAQAHRDWIFITLISPNNNVCRPSQDMVFFQITGDRVTITNYWISHNTCNTLLPRLIKTQQHVGWFLATRYLADYWQYLTTHNISLLTIFYYSQYFTTHNIWLLTIFEYSQYLIIHNIWLTTDDSWWPLIRFYEDNTTRGLECKFLFLHFIQI